MRTAVIGTGIMGAGMARSLAREGHDVHVWNRTPERAEAVAGDGITAHSGIADAVEGCEVVVTMLYDADSVLTYGEPHPKKRRVEHRLHYTQPVQHIVDPLSAEIDGFGDSREFFDQQLRRAIAIQCKGMGFESARPEALEHFRGLVDSCMASLVP